jgi:hypothetical protein
MAHEPGRRLPRAREDALVAGAREACRLAIPMSGRFPRLLWDQTHGIDLGAPPSVSHEGVALWTVIWQSSSFGFAALCFTLAWSVGSAPTDFRATLVPGTSLVSDRVRIRRRSRRPRPVARHGLGHKPP